VTITVDEAADLIGIGRSTAYDAINRGELPHVRIGRRVLVLHRPLLDMLGLPNDEAIPDNEHGS
jgi:excisionase family DNA binding protein